MWADVWAPYSYLGMGLYTGHTAASCQYWRDHRTFPPLAAPTQAGLGWHDPLWGRAWRRNDSCHHWRSRHNELIAHHHVRHPRQDGSHYQAAVPHTTRQTAFGCDPGGAPRDWEVLPQEGGHWCYPFPVEPCGHGWRHVELRLWTLDSQSGQPTPPAQVELRNQPDTGLYGSICTVPIDPSDWSTPRMCCSHWRDKVRPGLCCLRLHWGRQPKQVGHSWVQRRVYPGATTQIPGNHMLTGTVGHLCGWAPKKVALGHFSWGYL